MAKRVSKLGFFITAIQLLPLSYNNQLDPYLRPFLSKNAILLQNIGSYTGQQVYKIPLNETIVCQIMAGQNDH